MTHSSSELLADSGAAGDEPGWAMAPHHAAEAGFDARGSWLLEPDTGTGMLLHPRDWTFVERRDVTAHLRAEGWSVVPIGRFLHLSSDGTTAIRLLARAEGVDAVVGVETTAEVHTLPRLAVVDAEPVDEALEASV